MQDKMNFGEWTNSVPEATRNDSLWKMDAYRRSLFAGDFAWHDVTKLLNDKRTVAVADQLYRAVGSISANLAEGYSRGTGKDRARFYEYALASARESRDWCYKARYILGGEVAGHRINWITRIVQLLLKMVPQQRGRILKETVVAYIVEFPTDIPDAPLAV